MKFIRLSNTVEIPQIGFGTYKSVLGDDTSVISAAIEAGYRHFDTAAFYENEENIGEAIKRSGIARSEFFITSKVWKDSAGYEATLRSFDESLKKLGTDYLDCYLIHWPRCDVTNDEWKKENCGSWKALEELYEAGRVRVIGVSNFLPHHLMNLFSCLRIRPMMNQLEFHPGYTQKAAIDFCRKEGIQVEAWSPLGRKRLMGEPVLQRMAESYGKSVAQLCIRFALQSGLIVLPKSSDPSRMKENLLVDDFTISDWDMSVLETLPQLGWSGEHPDRLRTEV